MSLGHDLCLGVCLPSWTYSSLGTDRAASVLFVQLEREKLGASRPAAPHFSSPHSTASGPAAFKGGPCAGSRAAQPAPGVSPSLHQEGSRQGHRHPCAKPQITFPPWTLSLSSQDTVPTPPPRASLNCPSEPPLLAPCPPNRAVSPAPVLGSPLFSDPHSHTS